MSNWCLIVPIATIGCLFLGLDLGQVQVSYGSILPSKLSHRLAIDQAAAKNRNLTYRRNEDDNEESHVKGINLLGRIEKIREVRKDFLKDFQDTILDRIDGFRYGRNSDPQVYKLNINLPVTPTGSSSAESNSGAGAGVIASATNGVTTKELYPQDTSGSPQNNRLVNYDDLLAMRGESSNIRNGRSFTMMGNSAFEMVPTYNQHSYFSHPLVTGGPRLSRFSRQVTMDPNLPQVQLGSNHIVAYQEPVHYHQPIGADHQPAVEPTQPIYHQQQQPANYQPTADSAPDQVEADSVWQPLDGQEKFDTSARREPTLVAPSRVGTNVQQHQREVTNSILINHNRRFPKAVDQSRREAVSSEASSANRLDETNYSKMYQPALKAKSQHVALSGADSYGYGTVSVEEPHGNEHIEGEKHKCEHHDEEEEGVDKKGSKEHHHFHHHHHHHHKKEEKHQHASQPVHLEIRIEGKSKSKSKSKGKGKGKEKEKFKGKEGDKVYIKFAQGHSKGSEGHAGGGHGSEGHSGEGHGSEGHGGDGHGGHENYEHEEYVKADRTIEDKKSLLGDDEAYGNVAQGVLAGNSETPNAGSRIANLAAVEGGDQAERQVQGDKYKQDDKSAGDEYTSGKARADEREISNRSGTQSEGQVVGHGVERARGPNYYFDFHNEFGGNYHKKPNNKEESLEEGKGEESKEKKTKKKKPPKEKTKAKQHNEDDQNEAKKEDVEMEQKKQDVAQDKPKEVKKVEDKAGGAKEMGKEDERNDEKKSHKSKHNHIELHQHKHFEHHEHINLHKPQFELGGDEEDVNLSNEQPHQQDLGLSFGHPIGLGQHNQHHGMPAMQHNQQHHGYHQHEPIPIKEHWIVPELHSKSKSDVHHHGAFVIEDTSELDKHGVGYPNGASYQEEVINHPHGMGVNPIGHFSLMEAFSSRSTAHAEQNSTTIGGAGAVAKQHKIKANTDEAKKRDASKESQRERLPAKN